MDGQVSHGQTALQAMQCSKNQQLHKMLQIYYMYKVRLLIEKLEKVQRWYSLVTGFDTRVWNEHDTQYVHIHSMSDNQAVKQKFKCKPSRRRSQGRPRKCSMDVFRCAQSRDFKVSQWVLATVTTTARRETASSNPGPEQLDNYLVS